MDDTGLDNVDAERIFLLEFHFFELRQNISVGRTEGKMVDFIDADPAQVVVFQTLRGVPVSYTHLTLPTNRMV